MNIPTKPRTFCANLAKLPRALMPLTQQGRWVVWRWEWRVNKSGDGKWTKPPFRLDAPGVNAKNNDPSTWGTYEDAVACFKARDCDGIGFMLLDSEVLAGDLDHCFNPETGMIDPWAADLTEEATGAYVEQTVSGRGLRIIGVGCGDKVHRKFPVRRSDGAHIELYRRAARYITISGLQLGTCDSLTPLDWHIDTWLARFSGEKDNKDRTACGGFDFNEAGAQQTHDYEHLICNGAPEGTRSELFQAVVWHLAGKGLGPDEIADELAKHPNGIGQKYADRLRQEVLRSYEKWQSHKRGQATGQTTLNVSPWPQIHIRGGELPRIVNEAEDALLLLNHEIYQRGGLVVRPVLSKLKASDERETMGWRLVRVTEPYLVETLCRAARFLRYDKRSSGFVPTDAPKRIAETYLAREGLWRLPVLAGVVTTPFLRNDGSICEQPGYDAASGLLFKAPADPFPPVPQQPTRAEAIEALGVLKALISTFPFETEADHSVALSGLLTALDRRSMDTAPLHTFLAPAAGTGKSLLADIVSIIANGRLMPVIKQGKSEEELEKHLSACLLAGDATISIDNCDHVLQSSLLCQALTQQVLNIRILGLSKTVEILVNSCFFATGNNLEIAGDLTRRSLRCFIDAHCERPELREFTTDVIEVARATRGKLVVAALTILRAWQLARPKEGLVVAPFGSFAIWNRRVREALVWLGCADPCGTVEKVRESDPARDTLLAVITCWRQNLREYGYTPQEVINRAMMQPDFQTALLGVAASRPGSPLVSNVRLGLWLKKVEGKIVDGCSFVAQKERRNGQRVWYLTSS